jgi:nucleotide-binding universal stress UspA family protein/nitrite reductase/ring-hydroxylating ferredoxin subunit
VAYKRILFGTDGSPASERAGAVAIALAKAGAAELIVAHVYEGRARADDILARAMAPAEAAGVKKLSGELREGVPAETIAELAEEKDVGLLIVSGGRGQRYNLGQVAQRLSHRAPCDMLIVSDAKRQAMTGESPFKRVMIATDGSPTADRAARKGFDLAESVEASVTLVFVGHPKTGELVTQDTISVFAGEVPADAVMRQGDAADEILEAADAADVDLIVVGNKGMTGAKRFLLGSVPAKVSEYATRDVLICRTVTQTVAELARGHGGIIVQQGEKLAAFMDEAGELHLLSAKCTHMGCTVGWNEADKVWDCPCHGSRFAADGTVINGPAARPLPPA